MEHIGRNVFFPSQCKAPVPAEEHASACASAGRIEEILQVLRHGGRFLICSHARPDGDAVGSMLAMGMFLEQLGKHADLVSADGIPKLHRELPGAERIRAGQPVYGDYDAVILLECDGLERTGLSGLEKFFLINIDHHATGREYAGLNWIDSDAASVGEMVYQLVKAAGAAVTPQMATCLYTTVLTDTGGFCYGGTRASTFRLAGELVAAGADPIRIAQNVYFSTSISKLMLLGAALENLECEGRLAWLWITPRQMLRAGATEEDCEGIVNYALCASGVEAAVFLHELPGGRIHLSLRSKGRVNVAAIAGQLGGGGHESAAGCTLPGPLVRARSEVLALLRPCVASIGVEKVPESIEISAESVSLDPVGAQQNLRVSAPRGL
jgi:bifunctional oligoribonuclease and PAP phosphatase NrnA